jgi:hypothetical protein
MRSVLSSKPLRGIFRSSRPKVQVANKRLNKGFLWVLWAWIYSYLGLFYQI